MHLNAECVMEIRLDRSKEVVGPGYPGAEDDARRDWPPLSLLPAEIPCVSGRSFFSTWETLRLTLDVSDKIERPFILIGQS